MTEITLPWGWSLYYSKTDVDIFLTQIIVVGIRLDKKWIEISHLLLIEKKNLTLKMIKYTIFLHGFRQNNTLISDKYDKYYIISKMCFYMGNIFFSKNSPCFTIRTHFSPLKAAYIRLIYYIILCKGIQIWTLLVTDFY